MTEVRIETSFDFSSMREPLGPYLMPHRYKVRIDDPRLPAVFTVSAVMENGRPVCDRLVAERREGGPPIRGTDLRVPLDGFLRHTAIDVAIRAERGHKGQWRPLAQEDVEDFYRTFLRAERSGRRRRKPDEARLSQVADLYRAAVAEGRSPADRIASHLVVSKEHARKLVGLARRAGLLGPAIAGQAGEGDKR